MTIALHSSVTPEGCGPEEFQCPSSGRCIDQRRVCDGRRDCEESEDENNCGMLQ